MLKLFSKIYSAQKTVTRAEPLSHTEVFLVGNQIKQKVGKLFNGSLAIRVVTAGSTNAEEAELNALGNAYYDVDRFGVHFVASPRHADMIFVTGPVSRNMAEALKKTYDAAPTPKLVIAVGDDAIDGGIFKGSYAVENGAKNVVPVDYAIPGDPPSPLVILSSLLAILADLETKAKKKHI
jgi:Ni,Fe-hydrogenase III small subunit